MNDTQTSILIVFIIYIVFMVAVGFFFSRRKMSNADYVLGGRSLNPWVTAMSAQASDMSGWLLTDRPPRTGVRGHRRIERSDLYRDRASDRNIAQLAVGRSPFASLYRSFFQQSDDFKLFE